MDRMGATLSREAMRMPVSQMSAVSSRAHVGSPLAFPWPNTCPEKGAAPEEHLRVGKRPRCLHSAQSRPRGGDTRTKPTQPQPGGEAGARGSGQVPAGGTAWEGPRGPCCWAWDLPAAERGQGSWEEALPPASFPHAVRDRKPRARGRRRVRREHRPGVGWPGCRWDPRLPAFDHDAHAQGQAPGPQTQASRGSHTRDGGVLTCRKGTMESRAMACSRRGAPVRLCRPAPQVEKKEPMTMTQGDGQASIPMTRFPCRASPNLEGGAAQASRERPRTDTTSHFPRQSDSPLEPQHPALPGPRVTVWVPGSRLQDKRVPQARPQPAGRWDTLPSPVSMLVTKETGAGPEAPRSHERNILIS